MPPETSNQSPSLAGGASWIYAQLQELAASLAPGTPLPPVSLLKNNYKVGYETLNRVLKALEASGWVAIRRNKGIFALRPDLQEPPPVASHAEELAPNGGESGYAVPWLQSNRQQLQLRLFDTYAPSIKSWQRLVKLYNQRSPLYHLELTESAPEEAAELNDAEQTFDLAIFSSHITRRLQLRPDAVLPLNGLLGDLPGDDQWHPFTWSTDASGAVTGVVPRVVTMLLEYNQSALRQIDFTWSAEPDPAELLRCARLLAAPAPEHPVFWFLGYMGWFYRFGVPLCNEASDEMAVTAEKLQPVLEFLGTLSNGEHLSPRCSEAYASYYNARKKEVVAPLTESWLTSQDRADSGFAPMPRLPQGREPLFGPELVISCNSFYPEECWNFIKFVLSDEAQQAMGALLPCIPARRGVMAQTVTPARYRSLETAARHGELVYVRQPWLFEARFIIELLIERYLKHEITAEMLAATLNERCNRFMRKFAHA